MSTLKKIVQTPNIIISKYNEYNKITNTTNTMNVCMRCMVTATIRDTNNVD